MSFGVPTRLSVALCVGIVALAVLGGYAARLPILSGDRVAAKLESFARRHGVNLRVQTYQPLGLSGLRFESVQLQARRGDYQLEADLREVDVRISLQALFSRGEIYPGELEVRGGDIRLIRRPGQAARAKESPPDPAAAAPAKSLKPSKSSGPSERSSATPLRAILHDVRVSVDLAPLPAMQRPLWVQRAGFSLRPGRSAPVEFQHAYGQMPDGIPFAIQVLAEPESASKTYLIKPRHPTQIDRWFGWALPFAVSTESIAVCPQCAPATVELKEVEFTGGQAFRARSDLMSLSAGKNEVRLNLATVSATSARDSGDDAPFPYQLANFELQYDALAQTTIVQGEVEDPQSGVASFDANWSAPWGVLTSHIFLKDFDSAPLWETLDLGDGVQRGLHSGEVETSYEPALDLLEFSLDLDSRDLVVSLPLVNDEPLEFEQLSLELEALFQPVARTLSVSRGEATLQGAGPVRLDGYAVDAGAGLTFEVSLKAEKLHPQRLRDALPGALTKLARGSNFEGEFGFQIDTSGHSRFPREINLSVDFDGDVEVLGDSRRADVLSLAGGGPPSIDLPGTLVNTVELKDWVDYDALPARVPLILAAAEDSQFFKHEGFDWVGLRAAMAFNIEEGALKRGGSTLSQQLSKNLFLDRDRTLARKLQEAYVTWRLEGELSKQRIMELYVNMVEWGPGFQGIRAAAQRYFGVPAEELGVAQTALLGAILPGPSIFGRQVLDGYLASSRLEKIEHILSNLRFMKIIAPPEYTELYTLAKAGQIGGLTLTICADDSTAPEGAPKCP